MDTIEAMELTYKNTTELIQMLISMIIIVISHLNLYITKVIIHLQETTQVVGIHQAIIIMAGN